MGSAHFSRMPNISIPRTKMKNHFPHKTTFNFGELIPIDCFEVLPGDTHKLRLSSFIRMSTPIAPIMDNIYCYVHAFFIPMRLVWSHTEEFFGANKTSAGPQLTSYTIPQHSVYTWFVAAGSVSHYLGKPVTSYDTSKGSYGMASLLKERCYYLTWSEWYRAQQVQNPFILDRSDNALIGSLDGTARSFNSMPLKVCKQFDYFTSCTIMPQYGSGVTLPLGSYAPVVTLATEHNAGTDPLRWRSGPSLNGYNNILSRDGTLTHTQESGKGGKTTLRTAETAGSNDPSVAPSNLYADLSEATAATVNELRYAFAVQKYLERSNFGSRFFEMLQAHYGITSPDSRLQRPEYLGGKRFAINIQQVLSTADYSAGTGTKVGATGANSVTVDISNLFTKGFVEPGYVMILLSTKQDHTYSQGLSREDIKASRFEIYSPEFANLGDQEITKKELYLAGAASDDDVFGYQEHWAEYRYRRPWASGKLDPNVTGSLDFWTLADKFASQPSLNVQFIEENRDNIQRALVTGSNGPDFIADFDFEYTSVRPMPAYTIPGLIDHFGSR